MFSWGARVAVFLGGILKMGDCWLLRHLASENEDPKDVFATPKCQLEGRSNPALIVGCKWGARFPRPTSVILQNFSQQQKPTVLSPTYASPTDNH